MITIANYGIENSARLINSHPKKIIVNDIIPFSEKRLVIFFILLYHKSNKNTIECRYML